MSLSPEQQFLRDLSKLTKKYGMVVGGCGCFGSPFVSFKGNVSLENLEFKDGTYHATNSSGKVVK